MTTEHDEPRRLNAEDLAFIATDPSYAHRRLHFSGDELTTMILAALEKRGLPPSVVAQSQWVWARSASGPELILILPGVQA